MRRPSSDEGFTLVELILVIAITGVVVPSVAAVLLVYFRTAFVASVRTDRAHDSNVLASYLQPDLASARSNPTLSGVSCNNSAAIDWKQQNYLPNGVGTYDQYVATYAVAAASGADAPFVLKRTLTVDRVSTSAVVRLSTSAVVVGHNLAASCDATFSISDNTLTATVTQSDSSANAEVSVLQFTGNIRGRK